jgi:subtilisin family serine protease
MTLVEKDFSADGNGDRNGHGTHCAGTVFGRDK